jgi:thiol-disulfide isomerase/thioredoxin
MSAPGRSGRETTVFRYLVPALITGLLPVMVAGVEAPGTDARTRIGGRVCTPEGKPVPGITLVCFRFDPTREDDFVWEVAKRESDQDGRYEFSVPSGNDYRVDTAVGKSTFARSGRIAARPGARIEVENLVVRPATASLTGRIVRSDGAPAAGVEFACLSESFSPFRPPRYPKTDSHGLFHVPNALPDEPLAFWAVPEVNQIQLWTGIAPTARSLELRLDPGRYIEMPPQWKVYSDAEAFARQMVDTKVRKRIDFALPDLEGRTVTLPSNRFQGKVVLVNLFGSWCGGCLLELPHLVRLKEKYGAQGLEIIGLAFEREPVEAGRAKLRTLLKENKVNYPVLFGGPTKAEHVIATIHGIERFSGYPTTLLIGRNGEVKHTEVGVPAVSNERMDWWSRRLEKKVLELLKDRK